MAIAAEILTKLKADASQFKVEMASARDATTENEASTSRMAQVGGAAFAAIGIAAAAATVIAVKAAMEFEQSHARLVTAVRDSGLVWQQQKEAVDRVDASMRQLGFTDTETENALSRAVTATKNMVTAHKELSVAADLAAARHIDLTSAMDSVIKAGNGVYTALTRAGIVTKEQAANFHDGAEAVQFLADKFHGQAQAAADTFSGRIKVLEAELDHLAIQLGQVLIPVIEGTASAISDTIGWLERNKEVAITLAVVIGGPLLFAMLAYLKAEALIVAGKLAEFWLSVIGPAGMLAQAIGVLVGTLDAAEVSMGALALSIALPIAAIVGVGILINKLSGADFPELTKAMHDGSSAAKQWADQTITAAKASEAPITNLKGALAVVKFQMEQFRDEQRAGTLSGTEQFRTITKLGDEYKILSDEIHKETAAAKEAKAVAEATAQTAGVVLPAAWTATKAAAKEATKAVTDSTAAFGVWGTQAAINAGIGAQALDDIAKHAKQMDDATSKAVQSATSLVQKFGDQTQVSVQEIMDWLDKSVKSVADWSNNMKALAFAGVDSGLLDELRAAGPKAAGLVQGLIDAVKSGNLNAINDSVASVRTMTSDLNQALDASTLATVIRQAETFALQSAINQMIVSGNEQALLNLTNSTDTALAGQARSAIAYFDGIHQSIDNVPKDVPVAVHVGVNRGGLDALISDINNVTGSVHQVTIDVAGAIVRGL